MTAPLPLLCALPADVWLSLTLGHAGDNDVRQYLVRCLGRKDMLPAIVFIFSRVGCDQAAKQV